jgi:hypothetical protein
LYSLPIIEERYTTPIPAQNENYHSESVSGVEENQLQIRFERFFGHHLDSPRMTKDA